MWRQIQPLLQIYSILTTLIPVCVIVSHCDYIVNYYDDDDLPGSPGGACNGLKTLERRMRLIGLSL